MATPSALAVFKLTISSGVAYAITSSARRLARVCWRLPQPGSIPLAIITAAAGVVREVINAFAAASLVGCNDSTFARLTNARTESEAAALTACFASRRRE